MAKFNLGAGPRPDRRAVELEQRLQQPADAVPASDPLLSKGRERNSFSRQGFIAFGRIVDAVAYARTYKVQCERGLGTLRCCDAAATSLGVIGARQLNTYALGQGVLVFYHPQASYHVILCAVPDWLATPRDGVSDCIFQGSNVGLQKDQAHWFPFTLQRKGGIIDFSAGRPADSLEGEWGAISALGGRVFIDDEMIQVAIDEETGLFLCYGDQYTRLAGRNFDLRTAGYLREDRDDESEFSLVEETTPYVWERLGLYDSNGTPHTELTAEQCQRTSPYRTRLEPISDRQLSIARDVSYRGYLGQGGKRQVMAPVAVDALHTYDSSAASVVGLSEEIRTLDGSVGVRAAGGIYFAKYPLIPAAKRSERPEAATGDRTADNYKSCGLFGSGPAHVVASAPTPNAMLPHVSEAAAVLDMVAYTFNWKGLHPFHYHALDWAVAEESEMPGAAAMSNSPPNYAALDTQPFLDQAPTYEVQVDDRYGLSTYYANIACLALLPNGGISQLDGWGSEQRSAGGNAYHMVPGDLVLSAGRNIVLQAGGDVIIKGHNGVDLSASHKAVRVGAGTDVMIMGGNLGCGGVLVESKANGPSFNLGGREDGEDVVGGIVFISKHSSVVTLGKHITMATNIWGDSADGHITIDAGDEARIIQRASEFHRHVATYAIDIFAGGVNNEFWPARSRFGSEMIVDGQIFASEQIASAADVVAGGASAASSFGVLQTAQQDAIDDMLDNINSRNVTASIEASLTDLTFLADNTDLGSLEFYYRASANLMVSGYRIHEPIWAQIARSTTGVPAVWQENTVVGDDHPESSPYPGIDIWFGANLGQSDLNLFDPLGMCARDRGATYESAAMPSTSWVSLDGNWPIIRGQ